MDEDRWRRIQDLYGDLQALRTCERVGHLAAYGDRSVAAEVASLFFTSGPGSDFLRPPTASRSPRCDVGDAIVGRYTLDRLLGRGAQGSVFAATDRLSGETVAVKLQYPDDAEAWARARRESAALRHLRLPGVLHLLDDGVVAGGTFVVTELVEGAPFPGASEPLPWNELAPVARNFLGALRGVHRLGVVHGDLKPSNVLVDASGNATILDLGISGGPAVWPRTSGGAAVGGTPAYMAPELLLGEPCSVRTDLFAAGVMLFEAVTGRRPFTASRITDLLVERTTKDAPRVREFAPTLPDLVAAGIDRLLAREPRDRPKDLEAALRGWLEDERSSLGSRLDELVAAAEDARALFAGPERIFHVPTDAARELERRAGPRREDWARELESWIRQGLAELDGGAVRVDPGALTQLRAGTELVELSHTWFRGGSAGVAQLAASIAERAIEDGRHELAASALVDGVAAAREERDSLGERRLLELLARNCAGLGTRHAFQHLLYELHRVEAYEAWTERLERIARAASVGLSGDWRRSLQLIDDCAPVTDDVHLERLRRIVTLRAARRGPVELEAERVEDAAADARASDDVETLAQVQVWQGWVAYRRGRFAEAAALQERAADRGRRPIFRATALLDAASARMEANDLLRARHDVVRARRELGERRAVQLEARIEWLVRSLDYRSRRSIEVDHELLESVPHVGVPNLQALLYLNEAAVAWRAGDLDTCVDLAARSAETWRSSGRGTLSVLPRALIEVVGPASGTNWDEALANCDVPWLRLQALALLVHADRHVATTEDLDLANKYFPRGSEHGEDRLEVLSPKEVVEALGGRSPRRA